MLAAIAALFTLMFALPQATQAQRQNIVSIDGVKKTILSTNFRTGDGDNNSFVCYFYLSQDLKEYVRIAGNYFKHVRYTEIDLTKYEQEHDDPDSWYWDVAYTREGRGKELFFAGGDPRINFALFTQGNMRIFGDPRPASKVCGFELSGTITDSKHGDGQQHSISLKYGYELKVPIPGTLTVDVAETVIGLSWTHGIDDTTPQNKLYYIVEYQKVGDSGWHKFSVGNGTSYLVSQLEPGARYNIDVLVLDESGNGRCFGQQTVTTKADTEAPSAPRIMGLIPTANTITVNWRKSTDNVTPPNQIRYRVWYGMAGSNNFTGGDILTDKDSYTVTGLEPDTEYTLYVMASDKAGHDASSAKKTIRTQAVPAENYVTIDGVEKSILSTKFNRGNGDDNAFVVYLYLSSDKKEYVLVRGNKNLHAIYDNIWLYKKEEKHEGQWYWDVIYTKEGYGKEKFWASGIPLDRYALFSNGYMLIYGDPRTSRKICGIQLPNGKVTDTKHGDGQEHTITINYKHERTKPSAGTLTMGTVTDTSINLSWTHGSDETTPRDKLFYIVEYRKVGDTGWRMPGVGNATSYTIEGLEPETEYEVEINVYDESGNYKRYGVQTVTTKQIDTQAPSAPAITSMTSTTNAITVNWTKSTDNVTPQNQIRYRVWCGLAGGNVYSAGDIVTNQTSYTVTGLEPDTEYTLYVMAFDKAGNNARSDTRSISTAWVTTYKLKVCGVDVTSANAGDLSVIPGVSGTANYDNATKTLTLDNATIKTTANEYGIVSTIDNLTIQVKGTSTISAGGFAAIRNSNSHCTITGGTLKVSGRTFGLYVIYNASMTIDNCNVESDGSVGTNNTGAKMTITNSTLTAKSKIYAHASMTGIQQLTLTGCAITQPVDAAYDASLKGVALNGQLVISQVVIEPTNTGMEYVDLGLPSGTKWATKNLGASKPSAYGDYYAWGETETKTEYTWATYKWGTESKPTKYKVTDSNTTLYPEDDAATAKLGSPWRMPTLDEIKELLDNCTWTWTTQDGKNGYEVKGSNGNTIFLPAAGYRLGSELYDAGSWGEYWSGSLYTASSNYACYLNFDSGAHDWYNNSRCFGFTVRPVYAGSSTGITQPEADAVTARKQGVYNLQGVRLGTSLDRLPKGIYIVDGKKVIKK